MRFFIGLLLLICLGACGEKGRVERKEKKILIATDLKGWQNSTSQAFMSSLTTIGSQHAFSSDTISDLQKLRTEFLKDYSALVLLNLSTDSFDIRQQADIQRYSQAGGGILHLNTTLNLPLTWPWYEKILHEVAQESETIATKVKKAGPDSDFRHLAYDGGRHLLGRLSTNNMQQQGFEKKLWQSLQYAIGDNSYNYTLANAAPAPEDNRFVKVVLDDEVNEPMELAVLADGKVIFIERRGKMKLYDPELGRTRLLADFDVCTSGNYEDGMLGLAADPNFEENNYIYLYYSPGADCQKAQQLSRFVLHKGDSLILASEKLLLEVPVQRETCCHSGGSITFDAQGNLYVSTGDNTSSKESDGYTPIDERPGRAPFDAQKSSANTHDLRGKVLRITPSAEGSYSIPDGNLFPKDGSEGRPEIYTMGARNPFRITVDHKTGYLYWGDVGPDVGRDGRYGPQSYDEWNQARKPGYFGWPYFQGDNKPFPDRNFETDEVGKLFDPKHPINDSPNNYGSKQLPPAQKAFIWYPKGLSTEFPMLGVGSNSAMSGPVYYQDLYHAESEVSFPAYYNGKLFIYEWARSWVKVVTMNDAGDLIKIEPFLPEETFVNPIEMEFGPDGAMYMLEYGRQYFADNPEAKLVRIEYAEGNRKPVAKIVVDKQAGAAPFHLTFSARSSFDHDEGDVLSYEWIFTDDQHTQIKGIETRFVFEKAGVYRPQLLLTDSSGASSSAEIEILVGNAPPEIEIVYSGNQSFYFEGNKNDYQIIVRDAEDEKKGGIDTDQLKVNLLYLAQKDMLSYMSVEQLLAQGDLSQLKGKRLIDGSDCLSCHHIKKKNIGPSYEEVAMRYKDDPLAIEYLADKIISGGNGNWGEKIMAGHPQHTIQEAAEMARFILSLAEKRSSAKDLSASGQLFTPMSRTLNSASAYLLSATYTDQGANGIRPLSTRANMLLSYPQIEAEDIRSKEGGWVQMFGVDQGRAALNGLRHQNWLALKDIDLRGIGQLSFHGLSVAGGALLLRLDAVDGPLIGRLSIPKRGAKTVLANI